jgi:hypothetical protein
VIIFAQTFPPCAPSSARAPSRRCSTGAICTTDSQMAPTTRE